MVYSLELLQQWVDLLTDLVSIKVVVMLITEIRKMHAA